MRVRAHLTHFLTMSVHFSLFQAPYVLTVRAIDNGEESQLFTDAEVYITVGDVSSNDGVPDFERPKVDEIAYVAEVSSLLLIHFLPAARYEHAGI